MSSYKYQKKCQKSYVVNINIMYVYIHVASTYLNTQYNK